MTPDEVRELESSMAEIWALAQSMGLDPFPTHFELVPASIMYEFGAYGIPGRFSHWTHGRAYQQIKTMYDYGLSKIYELVINTNPAYAFLLENNTVLQNKLVVAHVLAHVDFFKNNVYFRPTNRGMLEATSVNAERLRRYEFEHGRDEVERVLDAVLSIQEHVDAHPGLRARAARGDAKPKARDARDGPFDDLIFIGSNRRPEAPVPERKFPPEPEKDLLLFIAEHAPDLEPWERDIVHIVRSEQMYFLPQMQTKVMNEGWACATGESLLLTERGFVRFDDLYAAGEAIDVASGNVGSVHPISAFHTEARVPTVRIRTRRGYAIEGALKHRMRLADGSWASLGELRPGDRVTLASGTEIWPRDPIAIDYALVRPDRSLADVAQVAETSVSTVLRHRAGTSTRSAVAVEAALATTGYAGGRRGRVLPSRRPLSVPGHLDEPLAHVLGYFVGDGHLTKSGIGLTCGDGEYAAWLAREVESAVGVSPTLRADHTATGDRWRIDVHSRELLRLLVQLGIDLRARAPRKRVPDAILRSPRRVVSAFLRGYFDADSYAGPEGIILSSVSAELVRTVQIVLLNYGILSRQRAQADGCIHLEIKGGSAVRFCDEIGFELDRKQRALRQYVNAHQWFKREEPSDDVVSVEPGQADVYDVTVDTAHTYVASGLVNHNSYHHARIMREMDLPHQDYVEFARLHSGVLSPSRRSINPYYVGMKIFEDIERRWDEPTDDERERLGRSGGQGRAKIFEVRELDNDQSFLRNYLTKDLVEELDLYLYRLEDDTWVIVEKDWEVVRDTILTSLTNFGQPYIVVEDGDYRRNRELLLKHCFEGQELDLGYADKTLRHVRRLWGRPVHLETVVDGKPTAFAVDDERSRTVMAPR